MGEMFDTGDLLFSFVPIFIGLVFIIVIGTIIISAIKGVSQWRKNEQSPRLSVPAIVKAKRTNVSRHTHHNDNGFDNHSTSTSYYVTFEFDSGDRSEFHVSGKEFGLLAEGDSGTLTFQGTRYLGFERKYEIETM
ncbi:DUF2500 domain-containing protein [Heyndrickxia sp. NPDC080065]|uniref:DUF2500 domain-containing protein n=1 Tax=Heyndrickxia sp. NPDC080065 TaxID=3390568 RepID=UPI003CFFC20C